MFHSIQSEWESASKDNMSDVRELIPEFFYLPDFLVNFNQFDFGNISVLVPGLDINVFCSPATVLLIYKLLRIFTGHNSDIDTMRKNCCIDIFNIIS